MITHITGHTSALKLHAVITLVRLFPEWNVIQPQHPCSFKFMQASCSAYINAYIILYFIILPLFFLILCSVVTVIGASVLPLIHAIMSLAIIYQFMQLSSQELQLMFTECVQL